MRPPVDQVLTVAEMRAAEEALIAAGTSVDELMQIAGRGAADWVWRLAAHRGVTVLCGPGNNGGDGYVIAESIRQRGGKVCVIAASQPKTDAARNAAALFGGEVLGVAALPQGDLLVDCLFGSGLTRALGDDHAALLTRLAASHRTRIAIDLPSGVESDSGALLNECLPEYHLTIALGAWKYAHFLMPAAAKMGALRLVGIGVAAVPGAGEVVRQPRFAEPAADAHKYRRGLLGVIGGEMPGAALLACASAQGGGAGYVKLLGEGGACASTSSARAELGKDANPFLTLQSTPNPAQAEPVEARVLIVPPDLVTDCSALVDALSDPRLNALLIGPGLGRDADARDRLLAVLAAQVLTVIDADALILLTPSDISARKSPLVATPHEGELAALEKAFGLTSSGSKADRARALAASSGMIIVAKGPDSVITAPDGRTAFAPRASSWLSVAGTGDVLAGALASRLATGADPFDAACQAVWLHGEAARLAGPALTASALAAAMRSAYAACL